MKEVKKTFTGKVSRLGKKIYVGDKVIKWWGWEDGYQIYKYHTINEKAAHLMANGEMHEDKDGIIYCLGSCYNFWKGEQVSHLTEEDLKELSDNGIKEDQDFYVNKNGEIDFNKKGIQW